jgi:hypothetical protein
MGMESFEIRCRQTAFAVTVRFASLAFVVGALLLWPGAADAGQRCPSTDTSGSLMKVGVGGGVSCDEALSVIERFYDWYLNQSGYAQGRYIDGFYCRRASGSLGCRGKPKWIYADSHYGVKPWEWPAPWIKPKPPKPPKTIPFLTRREAKGWMREALSRHFGANWRYRINGDVRCSKRVKKNRVKCQHISWAIGDLSFWGSGTIWYRRSGWAVEWHYSFTIRRLDEYCAFVLNRPLDGCLKTVVVR